jgi:nicotinamide-nucleotide amidase
MDQLLPLAAKIGALLKERKETIAVAESSAGGLISAALLSVPGASVYFAGGGVIYNRNALMKMMSVEEARLQGQTPLSESNALFRAQIVRAHLAATWGVSESGAAGPEGNRYGHAPGLAVIAVSGPVERAKTLKTGSSDRVANMYAFAAGALELLAESLQKGR